MELCSAKAMAHAIEHGAVAWFALIRDSSDTDCNDLAHDASRDCLHGASSPSNGCSAVHSELDAVARDMDRVCERYASVFAKPGKPAPRSIMHRIDLLDEYA